MEEEKEPLEPTPEDEGHDAEFGQEIESGFGQIDEFTPIDADITGEPVNRVTLDYQRIQTAYKMMLKEITSWGWLSLFWGVVSLVSSNFQLTAFSVGLILVGAFSFLFQGASMFVLYAAVMLGAAVQNILSAGLGPWLILGFLQFYWSYNLMRKYQAYIPVEKLWYLGEHDQAANKRHPSKVFPIGGFLLGVIGFVSVAVGVGSIFAISARYAVLPDSFFVFIGTVIQFVGAVGLIGLAVSAAALLSGYDRKWMSWIGVVCGVVLLGIYIYLMFVGSRGL